LNSPGGKNKNPMKKWPVIINGILVVAVIVLYILFFASGKKHGNGIMAQGYDSLSGNASVRIAYINTDTLLNNYDRFFELRKQITDKQQRYENELSTKQVQLQKKISDYQSKVQKGLLLRSEMQEIEQQLNAEGQNFQQLQMEYNQQLNEEMQVMNRKLYEDIVEFLKEYNKDHQYAYILSDSYGGGLLYADKSLDITWDVIRKMNEKYKAEKAKN
jgi:outer membrane protein